MEAVNILSQLCKDQQEYYIFLAKECFSGFSNAENNFNIYSYASCYAWLFHSSEFFWKALIILSGKHFEPRHEAYQDDIAKISNDLLLDKDKIIAYQILSKFSDTRRDLARYGYYEKKETIAKSPVNLFGREETETSLNEVAWLIDKLKEIHYYQIFEPPIRIGILSGYIISRKEKPCVYYQHSQYRKAVQWMLDINNIAYGESNLFQASLTPISNLNTGTFPIIINPFGEAYPELGNAEGVGFKTILSYIRDGGIFVNSGGQPFVYSWDVLTGNYNLFVNFIPALTSIQSVYDVDGNPDMSINDNLRILIESLPLKRHFDVRTEWDRPEINIVGPQEVDIEFDRLLDENKKTKAKVFRPVKELSDNIIPLAHCYNNSIWGNVYPIVAIKFGRGFLIHTGMSLDEEREYKILLDTIRKLSIRGYQMLARPYNRISNNI